MPEYQQDRKRTCLTKTPPLVPLREVGSLKTIGDACHRKEQWPPSNVKFYNRDRNQDRNWKACGRS